MNGLQVVQQNLYHTLTNYPVATKDSESYSLVIGDPVQLDGTIFSGAGQDDKFQFRQQKITGFMYNNSVAPVQMTLQYLHVRRNIPLDTYNDITGLLQSDSISIDRWNTSMTTGIVASRYLKFGRVKKFILNPGRARRFSLRSRKGNKPVSRDIEGMQEYLGTKGFTKFLVFKADGMPVMYTTGSGASAIVNNSTTQTRFAISMVFTLYTSWYKMGQTAPASLFVDQIPSVVGTLDATSWTDMTSQPNDVL